MFLEIQTFCFSSIILVVLYLSIKQQSRAVQQKNRYFLMLLLLNINVMGLKILMALFSGYTSGIEEAVLHISTAFYYMNTIIIVFYWLLYLRDHVKGENASKKPLMLIFIPFMVISFISIILSFFGVPIMYTMTPYGGFEIHFMYAPIVLSQYVVMIASSLFVVWNRKELTQFEALTLIAYQLPPAIGIIFNELLPNVDLLWPSMTISLLIVYTNIQSRMNNTDPLTGVFNRREYEKQIRYFSSPKAQKKKVCAMMIDIDDFKQINDLNSHQVGDMILIEVSQILQRSVRKNDFIARIGGDEFCVIIENDQVTVLHEVINRINQNIEQYNRDRDGIPQIHVSIGYGIYDINCHGSFKEFFNRLDKQMYLDKNISKQAK